MLLTALQNDSQNQEFTQNVTKTLASHNNVIVMMASYAAPNSSAGICQKLFQKWIEIKSNTVFGRTPVRDRHEHHKVLPVSNLAE